MVLFDGSKMSKSLGNIVLLSEIFEKFSPEFIRFFILSTHYRHPLLWNDENLKAALSRYNRWLYHLEEIEDYSADILDPIYEPLTNDLNIVESFALFDKFLNEAIASKNKSRLKELKSSLEWFGCLQKINEDDAKIKSTLEEKLIIRNEARASKNFVLADEIRQEIESSGYEICDTASKSVLKKRLNISE
jgi:cysteinyl-tRNA synthetase